MPIQNMKKSIILQFKELVKAISADKPINELELLFTNRLYQFFTRYCKFPTHNNKEMFFNYYFHNPYNLKELFNIFLDSGVDCIFTKSQRDNGIIAELYEIFSDSDEELYTVIENKIFDFTALKSITLLEEYNFIIDWQDGSIIYNGIDNMYTKLAIQLLSVYNIIVDSSKKTIYCEDECGIINLKRLKEIIGCYEKDPFEYSLWDM